MKDSKHILSSKTIQGIIVMLLPTVAKLLGYDLTPEDATGVISQIDVIVEAAGALLATYGRVRATKSLRVISG